VTEPPELDRIRTALRTIDERAADQVKRCAVGAALLVDDLPLVWRRVNVLRVDRDRAGAADVAEEAEHLLGGLEHRGVILRGESSPGVAEALAAAGWTLDREAVMVRRHDRLPAASKAREVALEDLREHSAAFRASRPYGSDPRLIAELAALDARYTERAGARHFAIRDGDDWAASCQLLSADGVGELHAVGTLPEHRGRGHARAVIDRALVASAEAGNDFTFLQAVESDWPRHLYNRLGFEDVGRFHELYRFEGGHPAAALYASYG
jgi:ribosomal protein S18 acetylase RimI-like enzyme